MLRIAACSYDGSLFGWKVRVDEDEEGGGDGLVAVMDFGFNCSTGVLKCVAVSAHGKYLACGGTDERIRVFNVAENRSMGELGLHEGGITCLAFFDDTHMISGSEVCALFSVPRPPPVPLSLDRMSSSAVFPSFQDASLRIWRCHDWECMHVLHGHKLAITDVAIHPSGKLALSVSKDNTLRLWNLVHGASLSFVPPPAAQHPGSCNQRSVVPSPSPNP